MLGGGGGGGGGVGSTGQLPDAVAIGFDGDRNRPAVAAQRGWVLPWKATIIVAFASQMAASCQIWQLRPSHRHVSRSRAALAMSSSRVPQVIFDVADVIRIRHPIANSQAATKIYLKISSF